MKQLVTVTFETAENVNAEKLVEGLARQGNGITIQTQAPVYGRAENITFVSAEKIEEPATQPVAV